MVWAEWRWNTPYVSEIVVNFEYHEDVEPVRGRQGLYHMVCHANIDGGAYYFGLQTSVWPRGGEGVIFSRWGARDLKEARIPDDGWTQESGHEGDFIGVRRSYDFGAGKYQIRLGLDSEEDEGKWLGVWVKAQDEEEETWIGSLLFSRGRIDPRCYTTLEIYGVAKIAAKDVPYWKVTMEPPVAGGRSSRLSKVDYNQFVKGGYRNTLITTKGGIVTLEVGLDYIPAR